MTGRGQDASIQPVAETDNPSVGGRRREASFADVPFRSIAATIAMVLATVGAIRLLDRTSRILTWVALAAFFAVVLNPVVDFLVRRAKLRRGFAVTVVVVAFIGSLAALGVLFVRPLADQGTQFAEEFPRYVQDAEQGRGRIGELVKRYELDSWVERNLPTLRERTKEFFQPSRVFGSAVGAIGSVFNVLAAVLTTAVLTILMLMEGHGLLSTAIRPLSPEHQARVRRVGRDSARALTGYVAGNLLISVVAGMATWVTLSVLDVPYAGVLALWVAFADLIPLVGATLGAIPAVCVAFLSSTADGIAVLIVYALYQQFENHVLSVTIMSKTVALKPLVILVSLLLGVELFGLLGALLAIPLAGVIKVVGADLIAARRPDLVGRS